MKQKFKIPKSITDQEWQKAIPGDAGIIVGLSGGADSMFCMLYLLYGEALLTADSMDELLASEKTDYRCVGYNAAFKGRGQEAKDDVDFLEDFCEEFSVPFHYQFFHEDEVEGIGNLEADLRMWRYEQMIEYARESSLQAIAVGHHQDDVAESFLLMALRGSGPRGIGSLREVRKLAGGLKIIRPLLNFSRDQIHDRLEDLKIEWREDSMNADGLVRRNVLRHQVFPILNDLENATAKLFAQTAKLCATEHDLLEDIILEKHDAAIFSRDESSALLDSVTLSNFDESEFMIFMRAVISRFDNDSVPSLKELRTLYDHNARIEKHEMEFEFRCGIYALLTNQFLFISTGNSDNEEKLRQHLIQKGFGCLSADDSIYEFKELKFSEQLTSDNHQKVYLPVELKDKIIYDEIQLTDKIVVENKAKKKVGELLTENKIPRAVRQNIHAYISEKNRDIIWIPGIRRIGRYYLAENEDCIEISFVSSQNDAG